MERLSNLPKVTQLVSGELGKVNRQFQLNAINVIDHRRNTAFCGSS